jgi:ribosomal protein L7/L12
MKVHEAVDITRRMLADDPSASLAISWLKASGFTIIESIKIVRQACGISLEEAKLKIASHPDWSDAIKAAEPLWQELIDAFSEQDKS